MSATVTLSKNSNSSLDGLNLRWTTSNVGTLKETTLVYFKNLEDATIQALDIDPSQTTLNLSLEQGETYSFQLQVTNTSDVSTYSNTLVVTAPFLLTAPVIDTWSGHDNRIDIVLESTANELTTNDKVEFVLKRLSDNALFWIIKSYSAGNSYSLTSSDNANLVNSSSYRVACMYQPVDPVTVAKYPSPSDISNSITATPSNKPDQVENITLETTGVQTLELTGAWDLPADFADWSAQPYSVLLQLYTSDYVTRLSVTLEDTDVTSYVFEDLPRADLAYKLNVQYTNVYGQGPVSQMAGAFVKPTSIPDAPTDLEATAGDGEIALSWLAPVFTGQTALTAYKVYQDGSLVSTIEPEEGVLATSYTATGLTNGEDYTFDIVAVNGVGESVASEPVTARPAGEMSIQSVDVVGKQVTATISPNGRPVERVLFLAIDSDPNDIQDQNFIYETTSVPTDTSGTIQVSHTFSSFSSNISFWTVVCHTSFNSAFAIKPSA